MTRCGAGLTATRDSMDNKHVLYSPRSAPRRRSRVGLAIKAAPIAIMGICSLFVLFVQAWHAAYWVQCQIMDCSAPELADKLQYPGESISWERCGEIGSRPLECSTIHVPMDHFGTAESKHKNFTIPLIRLRGRDDAKNVLLNPGGPGGSGVNFVYRAGEELGEILGQGYHLLSFDPRGINGSSPQARCYPDEESSRRLSPVDGKWALDPFNTPELYAWTSNFGKACKETMGEHGEYINTPQTAADMNYILDAVGQEEMYYWGFSYGTLLGQTYATLFPDRSHRVIIDGVVNVFDWYSALLDAESTIDTDLVLDGFLAECAEAGPKNCSLATISPTKQGLWDALLSLGAQVEKQPMSIYVNSTAYGTMDRSNLFHDAIFPVLYKPKNWPALAGNLTLLLQGNASVFHLNYLAGPHFELDGEANEFVTLNDGASGLEIWPHGAKGIADLLGPYYKKSKGRMFRQTETKTYFKKQQWAVPKTHRFVPKSDVRTAHPLLILSTTYDPVCPLMSAKNASSAFVDSRIIEVKGYGHCSLAIPSKCVAQHVRAFFNNGTLPEAHLTQCEREGVYFPAPEKAEIETLGLDDEDARLHRAQVNLGDVWDWAVPKRW